MPLTLAHTAEVVKTHARGPADTGSPEVQVALLTTRINELTPHFKTHAKDQDRKSTRLNASHSTLSRMPSSA